MPKRSRRSTLERRSGKPRSVGFVKHPETGESVPIFFRKAENSFTDDKRVFSPPKVEEKRRKQIGKLITRVEVPPQHRVGVGLLLRQFDARKGRLGRFETGKYIPRILVLTKKEFSELQDRGNAPHTDKVVEHGDFVYFFNRRRSGAHIRNWKKRLAWSK